MIIEYESQSIEVSMLEMARTITKLAGALPVRNSNMRPTMPFLKQVAELLASKGLKCDTTAAWQFWQLITEAIDAYSQAMEIESEIAWEYHIDPTQLSEETKLGLERNIVRNRAKQRLANGDYSPTDYEGVYNLALLATGDEAYSQKLKTEAFQRFVDSQAKRGQRA